MKVNDTIAFVAAWDHSQGGTNGGLWMLQILSPLPDPNTSVFPFDGASKLAANKGLGGNQPTSLAIGPDGAAYFGNLKNNNLLRIPQPTNFDPNQNVITVGGIPSAKSIFALVFNGGKLYAGASTGFYVFGASSDITKCSGNANNCGTPTLLMGGTPVNGVASDGLCCGESWSPLPLQGAYRNIHPRRFRSAHRGWAYQHTGFRQGWKPVAWRATCG